ncbi:MAG: MBL fold metallo-hydrolase [Dehalococcoidia bacterium]
MVSITVYGGAEAIGGNKILLEDGPSRLFFDFGTSFKVREKYFEEFLNPRPGAGLLDLLEMEYAPYGHLLPPLEGIYRPDLLPSGDIWSRYRHHPHYRQLDRIDGVLVSHAHVDHTGYISFLRAEIPVYASGMTAFIAKAMQDSGQSDFEKEVCYLNPRVLDDRDADSDERGYLATQREQRQRPFALVDSPELADEAGRFWTRAPSTKKFVLPAGALPAPDRVGTLPVRCFPIDHSIFGASAWAVETSAGWVVYTGDVRVHGARGEGSRRFIEQARALRPRVLLCEGTRVPKRGDEHEPDPPLVTERDVEQNALRQVEGEERLVVADFGPRNIERLQAFLRVTEHVGRTMLVLAKDAYLLDAMSLIDPSIPTVRSHPALRIYRDLKSKSQPWEKKLREEHRDRFVTPEQVQGSPDMFVLCFSFWDVKNLIDIRPQGGRYIYSSSEAYTEEQRLDLVRLRNWLRHFSMKEVGLPLSDDGDQPEFSSGEELLHASGHASGPELIQLVREISPRTLIPIHTENPRYFVEALAGEPIEVLVPEYGKPLAIG